jgi:hypothetical protein
MPYNSNFPIYWNNNISPYNEEYNTLYPMFSSNCGIYGDNCSAFGSAFGDFGIPKVSKDTTMSVIYNIKFMQTLCIVNPSKDMMHVAENHSEFGFVQLFSISTNNDDTIQFIKHNFNKIQFNDIEEINKKLDLTSQYINLYNHSKSMDEETQVKKYISLHYVINNNINDKMKASTLHDNIINSNEVEIKINGFKLRLSRYLKDLGLLKKRYNDGYYYYGIHTKQQAYGNDKLTAAEMDKLVSDKYGKLYF